MFIQRGGFKVIPRQLKWRVLCSLIQNTALWSWNPPPQGLLGRTAGGRPGPVPAAPLGNRKGRRKRTVLSFTRHVLTTGGAEAHGDPELEDEYPSLYNKAAEAQWGEFVLISQDCGIPSSSRRNPPTCKPPLSRAQCGAGLVVPELRRAGKGLLLNCFLKVCCFHPNATISSERTDHGLLLYAGHPS